MALLDNITAYWKLDESSGTADDTVGTNDLANTSVTYSAGKLNNGANFNGSSSKLQANSAVTAGAFSISHWFKTSSSSLQILVNIPASAGGSSTQGYILITSGQVQAISGSGGDNLVTPTSGYADGNWHHVVYTVSGGTGKIYMNGTEVVSGSVTTVAFNWYPLLGRNNNGNYLNGSLDECGIWARALTSAEVTELYGAGTPPAYPFSTSVSVDAGVQTATFSTPAETVTGGASTTPTVPVATFNTNAPAVSGGATTSPTAVTATFSIPIINVITPDAQILAGVQTATFSIPAYVAQIDTSLVPNTVTATFSTLEPSIPIGYSHPANALVATFTVPAYTLDTESNITITPDVQVATFSVPAYTVSAEINGLVEPNALVATFTVPEYTVTAVMNIEVAVEVLTATFSTLVPTKVGGLWTAQGREEGVWTPQARII